MMRQNDKRDCSLFVLNWFCKKKWNFKIDFFRYKNEIEYSEYGIPISLLSHIAYKNDGIKIETFHCTFREILKISNSEYPFGCLINKHNLQHMVVVKGKTKKHFKIWDPVEGNLIVPLREFRRMYLNCIFVFSRENQKINNPKFKRIQNDFKIDLIYILILTFSMLLSILSPFVTKFILDHFINNFKTHDLLLLSIIQVSILFLKIVIEKTGSLRIENKINQTFLIYKNDLCKKFLENKSQFNFSSSVDETIKILKLRTKWVFEYKVFPEIVVNFLLLFLSLFFMWKINNDLMIIICLLSIFYFVLNLIRMLILNKNQKQLEQDNVDQMNQINNIWKLKYLSEPQKLNDLLVEKLNKSDFEISSKLFSRTSKVLILDIIGDFLEKIIPFMVLIISIFLLWFANLELTEVILFLTLIHFFQSPISKIPYFLFEYSNYKNVLTDYWNWEFKKDKWNKNQREIISEKINSITIQNGDVYIFNKKILDIDYCYINSNVLIKGGNGIGKSTFCRLISNLTPYKNGSITINEKYELKNYKFNENVCLINTNENFPNLKVKEFLQIYGQKEWVGLIKKYDLHHILIFLGIDTNKTIDTEIKNFSTGQLKFINLLRLMIKKYDLIILDEAFDGLDPRVREFMILCIRDYQKGAIFIEISHSNYYVHPESKVIDFEKVISK